MITFDEEIKCCKRERISFWDNVGDKSKFMRLSKNEREKAFLVWKYGTNDFNGNKETELTDFMNIDNVRKTGLENYSGEKRKYWELEIKSHEYAMKIKVEIGLSTSRHSKVKELIKTVSEDQVSWDA